MPPIDHLRSNCLVGSFSTRCKCGRLVTMQTPAGCLVPMPDDGRQKVTATSPIASAALPDCLLHVAHQVGRDCDGVYLGADCLVAGRAGQNDGFPLPAAFCLSDDAGDAQPGDE